MEHLRYPALHSWKITVKSLKFRSNRIDQNLCNFLGKILHKLQLKPWKEFSCKIFKQFYNSCYDREWNYIFSAVFHSHFLKIRLKIGQKCTVLCKFCLNCTQNSNKQTLLIRITLVLNENRLRGVYKNRKNSFVSKIWVTFERGFLKSNIQSYETFYILQRCGAITNTMSCLQKNRQ